MIFSKKKKRKMVDLRDMQRRGVVRLPKTTSQGVLPMNKEGFVEMGTTPTSSQQEQSIQQTPSSSPSQGASSNFGDFFNMSPSSTSQSENQDTYTKRETDTRITDMDNKIYKLEQRIELLERKMGINDAPSNSQNTGVMGW